MKSVEDVWIPREFDCGRNYGSSCCIADISNVDVVATIEQVDPSRLILRHPFLVHQKDVPIQWDIRELVLAKVRMVEHLPFNDLERMTA